MIDSRAREASPEKGGDGLSLGDGPSRTSSRPEAEGQDGRNWETELGLPPRREDALELRRRATYKMSAAERELGLPPLRRRESYMPFSGRSFGEYSRRRSERMVRIEREQSGDGEWDSAESTAFVARGSDYRRSAQEIALGLPPLRVRHGKEEEEQQQGAGRKDER